MPSERRLRPCAPILNYRILVHHSRLFRARIKIKPQDACLFQLHVLILATVQSCPPLAWFMMAGGKRRSLYGPRLWILTAAVVLALGLGLGLGLGLKHRHHDSASTEALPFLSPQTSSNFVVGSIVGQSPQDRNYNFTLALANGAPDGVNKTMLVVNGTSLRSCRDHSMTAEARCWCDVTFLLASLFSWLSSKEAVGRPPWFLAPHLLALYQRTQASSPLKSLEAAPLSKRAVAVVGTDRGCFWDGIILRPVSRHFWISVLRINSRHVPWSNYRG